MSEYEYIFIDDDRDLARYMAEKRGNVKHTYNVPTHKIDSNRDDLTVDYFGALGEITFGKFFNREMDIYETVGGDGVYDFIINNLKIDVKQTIYKTGRRCAYENWHSPFEVSKSVE